MSNSKCQVNGKDITLCSILEKAISGACPTPKAKGVFLPYRINTKTGEKGADIVQLHSGEYVGRGIAMYFCPFCGESLKTWES